MDFEKAWTTLCPPAQIYPIVMLGVILFSLWRGTYRQAVTNMVSLVVGTFLLWVLCAANLEFVAYALLLLPVLFFVFFLAIVVFDQSLIDVKHKYKRCGCPKVKSCGCQPVL